ncbi:hypothetical protein Dimus_039797 [Dionaea muscipula]
MTPMHALFSNEMIVHQMDPDVVRWGLNQLCARPSGNVGCHGVVTFYDRDMSHDGYILEEYSETLSSNVENDAIIARALQEEFSALAAREAHGYSDSGEKQLQASISAQSWLGPKQIDGTHELTCRPEQADENGRCTSLDSPETSNQEGPPLPPEEINENALDGQVEKRLDQMIPIPHVPRINGEIPSDNDAESDHQRLLDRLKVYELVELKVKGDGNCQFRSLSDQIYRNTENHGYVRQVVLDQLKSHPEIYEGYVPMSYGEYLKRMSKTGEWGDHVTLQAAADTYGIKIFVLTSFKDTCYIEILPRIQKSDRVIFLSFWAEVHYNSIYPEGEFPVMEPKKTGWRKLFGL